MECKCHFCGYMWTREESIGVDVIANPWRGGYVIACIDAEACRMYMRSRIKCIQPALKNIPAPKTESDLYWDKVNKHQEYLRSIGIMEPAADLKISQNATITDFAGNDILVGDWLKPRGRFGENVYKKVTGIVGGECTAIGFNAYGARIVDTFKDGYFYYKVPEKSVPVWAVCMGRC